MLFADSVVIDVTHHIHDFAGHFLRSGCITAVFVFLRDRQRRHRQCCDERRCNSDFHQCRFVVA